MSSEPQPSSSPDAAARGGRWPRGAAITAMAIGVFTVAAAVMTWVAWFLLAGGGWFAYTPSAQPAVYQSGVPSAWVGVAGARAVGMVWFALVPTSCVGVLFARLAARGGVGVRVPGARAGTVVCVLGVVLAAGGAAWFGFTVALLGPYHIAG